MAEAHRQIQTAEARQRARAALAGRGSGGAQWQRFVGAVALLAGLLGWEAAAWALQGPPVLLPYPHAVAARLWDLATQGILWRHIGVTLAEAGLGFALAAVFGLVLAYPVAKSRLLEAALAPYVAGTQAVPVVAVAPLMVLWFGLDLMPKVITCAIICYFPILVSTVVGLRGVDRALIEAAQTFGAGRAQILRWVEAPLAARAILGGLKLGITLAMTGAVVGEFIAANAGLGYLLTAGRSTFDTTLVFAALAVLVVVAICGYTLLTWVDTRFIDWE
jgi:NitT/TauT family transport system permease protein